jgi:hypothetical protein
MLMMSFDLNRGNYYYRGFTILNPIFAFHRAVTQEHLGVAVLRKAFHKFS